MFTCRHIAYRACLVILVGCGAGGVAKTRDASLSSPFMEMSDSSESFPLAVPTFNPPSGTSSATALSITLSAANGATIYYTTDGTAPSTNSAVFRHAIPISAPTTVRAFAHQPGVGDSRLGNATYVISSGPAWTANIGVVVDSPVSYNPDRLFADAIKSAREFASYSDLNTPVGLDSDGWPKEDASILVWEGAAGSYVNGRYRFSCDGRVTGNNVTATDASFGNWSYDPVTNRSAADLKISKNGNLALFFKGIPGGVKHVKLIRPGLPNTNDFNPDYLKRLMHFSSLRTLDFVAINNSPIATWSQRTRPSYATQGGRTLQHHYSDSSDPPAGVSWEYFIRLCNQVGKDAWINIPHQADDTYITNLALLFRYGSDANGNPYKSAQASPVSPPLRSDLHLYVEWSNEVWNSGFIQARDNNAAADVEYANNDVNHYAFDKTGASDANLRRWRRTAFKSVRVSEIFRGVFGDSAMITTVRPILALWTSSSWLTGMQLRYIDHVFGPLNSYGNPRRKVNEIIYGVAGTTYTYLDDDTGKTAITVDQYFSQLERNLQGQTKPWLRQFSCLARKYGVAAVCYEGSQHTLVANSDEANTAVQLAAQYDARMKTFITDMYTTWFQVGGGLHSYSGIAYAYSAVGQWGLGEWGDREDEPAGGLWHKRTSQTSNDGGTPKWAAVKSLIGGSPIPPTEGKEVPATLGPADACAHDDVTTNGSNQTLSGTSEEPAVTYWFRTTTSGKITLSTTLNGAAKLLEVSVDGSTLTPTGGWQPGAQSVQTPTLAPGLHGLRMSARPGAGTVRFSPLILAIS
jgi:hypothetical protein